MFTHKWLWELPSWLCLLEMVSWTKPYIVASSLCRILLELSLVLTNKHPKQSLAAQEALWWCCLQLTQTEKSHSVDLWESSRSVCGWGWSHDRWHIVEHFLQTQKSSEIGSSGILSQKWRGTSGEPLKYTITSMKCLIFGTCRHGKKS